VSRDEEHSEQIDWFDLDSADDPASDTPPRQPWPRWFTLAVVAAVIVAFAMAVLNHQRRARSAAPQPTSTTSPASAAPAAPRTSAPVTVTPVPSEVSEVSVTRVGHPLLTTTAGWELFGRSSGVLVRIQPAAGRITRTTIPALQSSGPVTVVAGSDRVIIRPLDNVPGYLVPDGKPARQLSPQLIENGPVFPGPTGNQMWVARPSDGGKTVMGLANLDGTRLAGNIPIPPESSAFEAVPDGAGYLLFAGVGGLYDARPGGLHRITTGTLLAVGPTGWLVLECDEQHRCHPVLVGRVDGSRRAVNEGSVSHLGYGVISPDGSIAAMLAEKPDGGVVLYLLDLASGRHRDLGLPVNQESPEGNFLFSPDGRWLFAIKPDGTLAVANCRTGAVDTLNVPLPALSQLVVRPAR
jgi:WD40-like Beta Propeller Repeat